MVKIEWFDLKSDAVKEYLKITIQYIRKKYEFYGASLDNKIKNEVFCNSNGDFSEEKVIKFLTSTRHELFEKGFFKEYIKDPSSYNNVIKEIFNYKILNTKRGEATNSITLRHNLLVSLNVDCCPYCNRQYITSYKNISGIKYATADLDHFYPRNEYPLFALSLFNFVPSCQICNSRMKHDKFKECLYPYDESFKDDAFFAVSINGCDKKTDEYYNKLLSIFLGRKNSNLSIIIKNNADDCDLKKRIDNSIELFKLNEVYQSHQEYVRNLLVKQRIYNEGSYLNMLNSQFKDLHLTKSDLESFLYGFRWDDADHHTIPLSKLTYDLVKRI